jgi:hypothetical protein
VEALLDNKISEVGGSLRDIQAPADPASLSTTPDTSRPMPILGDGITSTIHRVLAAGSIPDEGLFPHFSPFDLAPADAKRQSGWPGGGLIGRTA